jgi:UDP-N-acetylglucosamine 3-dehydrogenase
MKKIRYGIIGCGQIVHNFHMPDMSAINEAELIAVADINEERAKQTAKRWKAKACYRDYRDLLSRDDIDACIVATPHQTHAPIAVDVLKSGKHVLVQKPMATNMEDANKLVETAVAARQERLKTMCFPYNWDNAFMLAEKYIKNGTLGQIFYARRRVAHGGFKLARYSWFYDPKVAIGGVLFDMGVYSISGLTALLGPVKQVLGFVKSMEEGVQIDDNASLLLEFENGTIGCAETSWTQATIREGACELYGKNATMYSDFYPTGNMLEIYRKNFGLLRPTIKPNPPNAPHRHFVECILRDKQPKGTPEHAKHVVEIMLAGYESAKTGRRIDLKTKF